MDTPLLIGIIIASTAAVTIVSLVVYGCRKSFPIESKTVFITGGSCGIGLEIAHECIQRNAHAVIIAARREDILKSAVQDLKDRKGKSKTFIDYIVLDCCDATAVEAAVSKVYEQYGPIDACFSNIGYCKPDTFEIASLDSFRQMYEMNVMSNVTVAKYVLSQMVSLHRKGIFMFTSSMAGQVGLFGFPAYSGTKFAIRGLAEAMAMEYKPHGIHVGVIYPPATKTPGFDEEQKTKPKATFEMEKGGNAWDAADVAKRAVSATEYGHHRASIGFDGHIVSWLTAGFGPVTLSTLWLEILFASPLRLVAAFVRYGYDKIAQKAIDDELKTQLPRRIEQEEITKSTR